MLARLENLDRNHTRILEKSNPFLAGLQLVPCDGQILSNLPFAEIKIVLRGYVIVAYPPRR